MGIENVISQIIFAIASGSIALLLALLLIGYSSLWKKMKHINKKLDEFIAGLSSNESISSKVLKLEKSISILECIADKLDNIKNMAEDVREENGKLIQSCNDNAEAWLAMGERIDAISTRVQELEAKARMITYGF